MTPNPSGVASATTDEPATSTHDTDTASSPTAVSSTALSCTAEVLPARGGRIVVLWVTGEIDLLTYPTLHTAIDAALFGAVDHPTSHLVIDLAGVTFCCLRGFALLAATARTATAHTTGFALSGCPPHLRRHWRILRAGNDLNAVDDADTAAPVPLHTSAAAAVITIRAAS